MVHRYLVIHIIINMHKVNTCVCAVCNTRRVAKYKVIEQLRISLVTHMI